VSKHSDKNMSEGLWTDYQSFAIKKGISRKYAVWYVRWIKEFVRHRNFTVPSEISDADISRFVEVLSEIKNIQSWQIDQAVDAIKLFQSYLSAMVDTCPGKKKSPPRVKVFRDRLSSTDLLPGHRDLMKRLKAEIRYLHYSIRTEKTYEQWIIRFFNFHRIKPIENITSQEIREFLEYLAVERKVSSSSQNQALNALVFFFENVLKKEMGTIGEFTRAKRPVRMPVVLSKEEITALFRKLSGTHALMAGLLYGCGLRIMECVRLRIKSDFMFDRREFESTPRKLSTRPSRKSLRASFFGYSLFW